MGYIGCRVYWGNYACDPFDPATDELYKIALDDPNGSKGVIECAPKGTYVASQTLSYLVSDSYGRSLSKSDALRVSGKNELYHFQTHADILNVEPQVGSLEGGTLLTITGKYFDGYAASVLVGGVPCEISNITSTEIKCVTGPAAANQSVYPGDTGMLYEVWNETTVSLDEAVWDTSAADYNFMTVLEARSPEEHQFGEEDHFVGRLRGLFVPPRTGNYQFKIVADDYARLYLSKTGDPNDKEQIAILNQYTSDWEANKQQASDKIQLTANQSYYLEAVYEENAGNDFLKIGVVFFDVPVNKDDTTYAKNEVQRIKTESVVVLESQTLTVEGATYEVQQVVVKTSTCSTSCNYKLQFGQLLTGELSTSSTAEQMETALNLLVSPDAVSVTMTTDSDTNTYSVEFQSTQNNIPLLKVVKDDTSLDITISKTVSFTPVDLSSFNILVEGTATTDLSSSSTAEEVKSALMDLFSVQCEKVGQTTGLYEQDFEGDAVGEVDDLIIRDEEPFCGRASVKNPDLIFRAGSTLQPGSSKTMKAFDVRYNKKLCLAHRGGMKSRINLLQRWVDDNNNEQLNWQSYVDNSLIDWTSTAWKFECIDINEIATKSWFYDSHKEGYPLKVERIRLFEADGQDFFIDNMYIGNDEPTYTRTQAAVQPNGITVTEVNVNKRGYSFDITFTSGKCGFGYPLLSIKDAVKTTDETDRAVYTSSAWPSGVSISVVRPDKATEPITGTFDLGWNVTKTQIKVSSDATAEKLKEMLEGNFDIGTLKVTREGTCAGYTWRVEWLSKGGSQPLLQVNGDGLSGNNVSISSFRSVEGQLLMGPIPGEFLRLPFEKPQVEVIVNTIPSSCSGGQCTFEFSEASTPTVQTSSPASGTDGTALILTGSGFSTTQELNVVTIGGVGCDVTSASDTSISCSVGQAAAGTHEVRLEVTGEGLASYPNGPLSFQFELDVTGINPSSGSLAGGTSVTITGSGFGKEKDNVTVSVGDQTCNIESVIYSEIQCVIALNTEAPASSTPADVTVTVNGQSKALSNAFTFNPANTPIITDIEPKKSPVEGGGELTITGTGFGASGATVSIGGENCDVTSQSATEIKCTLSEHGPGTFSVELTVNNQGFANTNGITFQYELEVAGLFPDHGSLQGATEVTITGSGFGTNASDVAVILGDLECEIKTVSDDSILCTSASSEKTYRVDNNGKHDSYGLGYKWNPQILTITAGDVVVWQWATPGFVTGVGYSVHQTADGDSVSYDGKGFYSGTTTPEGTFAYRFSTPGTYYYSSGEVSANSQLYMKGTIIVKEPTSTSHKLTVEVSGYKAQHNTGSGVTAPVSPDACPGGDTTISECDTPMSAGDDANSFYFAYWICSTPVITKVTPNQGDSSANVTIQGTGFSTVKCENEIFVGDFSCDVQSSTDTELTCLIDPAGSMSVGEPRLVSVVVKNRGQALNQIGSTAEQGFTLKPRIDDLSQHAGSLSGGTKVIITGSGFAADSTNAVSVRIGDRGCVVQSVTYTEIVCVTSSTGARRDRRAAGSSDVTLEINSEQAVCNSDCSFDFASSQTPQVDSFSPKTLSGGSTPVTITGSQFDSDLSSVNVTIGGVECAISSTTETTIQCDVGYVPAGAQEMVVNIAGSGNANFNVDNTVTSSRIIDNVLPSAGSTAGGQVVTISGNGFVNGDTVVKIDGQVCNIQSVSLSEVKCKTPSHDAGTVDLVVTSNGGDYPARDYEYSSASTPTVTTVTPPKGSSGSQITLGGSGFGTSVSEVSVTLDGTSCSIDSVPDGNSIVCTLGQHSAGTYPVVLHVQGKGLAAGDTQFEFELKVDSVDPNEGSFGGGQVMTIQGTGFDDTAVVTICDNVCSNGIVSSSEITCEVPSNSGTDDQACDVKVSLASGASATKSATFTYKKDLTPVIDAIKPGRGGTQGGTRLVITGSGFQSGSNKVTIGGTECTITAETATQIDCTTEAHGHSEMTKVRVEVGTQGIATQENANFYYIDVWSSQYTWGGKDPPIEGDLVRVPVGQTLLLDVTTPILSMLLIQGGTVIFDEADIELHAQNILIVDGGHLQIGTEENPFQHEATIVMHGHVRSTELPLFGAKTLAIRNGTLDLHGKPVPMTWTRLAETAKEGETTMKLETEVTWKAGDEVVIASTGYRHSQYESEEVTITAVSPDGIQLTFTPALKYNHHGITQTLEGDITLEMRAEVGLLTRNVKVRGSVQEEWIESYDACPHDFDTGQFATQTCFLGKLGEETGSDQFGSQIMFFAANPDEHLVTGRIEYVEITYAGQSFRLGRYPIHFHMSGDVSGSYVRGCGIHRTFNRAVTIHGVHNLLVEHNVAYNIMGHAYFLEDGIETGNIIQYNLGIFVRPSSSLLNVDITPATYWVTNPDNVVRHNAAAGGSHFGFWYNMPIHPGGPSFTSSICPRNVPLGEFRNNSAHTQGWYGLWVFPSYHPKTGGGCNAGDDEPAKFYSLYAWETERGAEAVDVGAVQFHDFVVSDADQAGVEYQLISAPWGEGGALIKDLVVVAHSQISEDKKAEKCTVTGVHGPQLEGLTVDGVKFINFDQERCSTLAYCSKCRTNQGGSSVRLKGLEFYNSTNKAAFKWEHECWFEDLDGSLTGTPNHIVLPSNPNLPPSACTQEDEYGFGAVPGSSCDDTVRLHRLSFNNPSPSSLLGKAALFTNAHGTTVAPYDEKRITHPKGWMVTLIEGDTYDMAFEDAGHVTNITYDATFYEYQDGDYVLISHTFTQEPDRFAMNGEFRNVTDDALTYDGNQNGDMRFENDTKTLTYIVSGKGESELVDRKIHPNVYTCFYKDCLPSVPKPPPDTRPDDVKFWSHEQSWESGSLPVDNEDVTILASDWMVADVELPVINKLVIYGALEIDDSQDNKLEATYILIQGGRLVIGFSESNPFQHEMKILLNGHHLTEQMSLPNGPNLGSKALGVFGGLDIHGKNHSVYWTQLSATVNPGDNTLTVKDQTDWQVGDEILVATTSYEAWQTETFKIEAVDDASTFKINGSFAYRHIADYTADYVLAAEVGLLTRNVKIEGNDYEYLFKESFGARVLVGRFFQDGTEYKGHARISNVQFFHSGQLGWSDYYDPRYSLAFLDMGQVTETTSSIVKGCSFHNGFSPAIGVYGTNGLLVKDNVIHHTVGPGVIVWGEGNQLIHNLVTLVVFPGTYQDRFEEENTDWTGGIEVENANKAVLVNNTVAGSEKVAFSIKGEPCYDPPNPATDWDGNVGHSTLHGVYMFLTSQPECSKIANFLIYKSWDFGVYAQIESSIRMSGMTLVDNKMAVLPLVIGPNPLRHLTSDVFFQLEDSLIVGVSDSFDCEADAVEPENAAQSASCRSPRAPGKGHSGFVWASFSAGKNMAPAENLHNVMNYPTINGRSELKNVAFRGFGTHCGKTDVAIMTNPGSQNAQHPLTTSGITMEDVADGQRLYIHHPSIGKVNPADCVDMDCDGMKKAMIQDMDGSLLGTPGTVIPQSEYEWDGDPRRGLGDYRIPKAMLTRQDGSKIPVEEKAPNKGIYRGQNNECTWKADWQAYECHGIDHMMLVAESMDADTEVRRLSPLAMYSDSYVDLINGPEDHGWCNGYTCQERISTFYTMVAGNNEYEVYFTSTNPQGMRFHLLNSGESQAVVLGIWYIKPERLDVYYKDRYVIPNNAEFSSSGELIWKAKDPALPDNQFNPDIGSQVHGENYFDHDTKTLWVLVRGPEPVEIRTTAVVMVSFGVPAVSVDDFYENGNLVNNLAALLNLDPSQIRVVEVVREGSRRRRRLAQGESGVSLEIGPQPRQEIEPPGEEVSTEAPTTVSPGSEISLGYEDLLKVTSQLANSMQAGELSDYFGVQILGMAMMEPAPKAVDPTGGVRATNETGGPPEVPPGTKPYDEVMREEEEEENSKEGVEIEYRTPDHLVLLTQPGGAWEGWAFHQQPSIYVVDASGNLIQQLGSPSNPWQLTASVSQSTPNAGAVELVGNVTIPFDGSWANFTDLTIAAAAQGVVLDFKITFPGSSPLVGISCDAFDVMVLPSKMIQLRFLADYDAVAAGKEQSLIGHFVDYVMAKYDGIKLSAVVIERGSILISCDMKGDVDAALKAMWTDILEGNFTFAFDGQTLTADKYLLVNGNPYGPIDKVPDEGLPGWAIALIVIFSVAIVAILVLLAYKLFYKKGKTFEVSDEIQLTESGARLRSFSGSRKVPTMVIEGSDADSEEDVQFNSLSALRSHANSPRRTPEIQTTALPPGFTESTGQEEQALEERTEMFVMVKNQDDTFQKLCVVQANKVGKLRDLRADVESALPGKLQGKPFILTDESLEDISSAQEEKLSLTEVYHSDCVMIRWVEESGESKLCVCGLVGQFECSLCHQQTYCSPNCQSDDWVNHSMWCSNTVVKTGGRDDI
ncbi:fibrocystin-L-like [Patiria miniata]|uniref:Fibrocystin-L n=1 Tax=Patiria miniata TaxID=46514 RepID=A0A913Z221_PATMI|nr:fibrocystin-L-like [Patiria miniata]